MIATDARGSVHAGDTIVALATPPGRGAIALVRLSGADAFTIASRHLGSWPLEPRTPHLCDLFDGKTKLDTALVTLFPAPNSFTGEDTVEISTHGGYLVSSTVIAALTLSGARQASPGEFTRRAVLNGKLDILQAEGIGDLIDAQSHAMQRTALSQLDGGLSRRLLDLRSDLIGLEALLAYDVDFPEEDDGPIPRERIQYGTDGLLKSLSALLATAPVGELVRAGATVVIAGAPNVGKSSLFNALLGRSRAIVTAVPGTTRDALEAVVDSGKWPLRLIDTAGLRETEDYLERLGIEVSERYLADADVVLACGDNTESLSRAIEVIRRHSTAPIVAVRTKADLVAARHQMPQLPEALWVSAEQGVGLTEMVAAIERVIDEQHADIAPDLPILSNARHRQAIDTAYLEVKDFERAWAEEKLPTAVAAVHLRTAVSSLEELIGSVDIEDVLDRVFSSFCVGK
ncbi:MAG TPA: tRNA uridine-5-carboxymethylaminomethyl(34) synthesis GTPase MnmE [Gemmatimonadaceae bacterium]